MKFILNTLLILGTSTILIVACSSSNDTTQDPVKDTTQHEMKDMHHEDNGSHEHDAEPSSTHSDDTSMEGSHAKTIHSEQSDYPLLNCPVSGGKLGSMGDPIIEIIEGREVRFCCDGCPDKFKAKSAEYFDKMDQDIIALQAADYPLDYCLVSGDDFGKSIDTVVNNQLFRVCCKDCIEEINTDPAKFASLLNQARAGKPIEKSEGSHSKIEEHEHL